MDFCVWIFHDAFDGKRDLGEIVIASIGLGIGGLLIAGPLLSAIVLATGRVIVTASPEQLHLRTISWLGRRNRTIDAAQIEEIFVNAASPLKSRQRRKLTIDPQARPGVTIRTNHKTFCFGGHLPKPEQDFLSQFLVAIFED